MAKLTKEQIMVSEQMVQREVSIRQVAQQLGVTEGALRYHFRKRAEGRDGEDGRRNQPTAVDGYEEAADAILERLGCRRVTGEGRPVQARTVYELLGRDYGYPGSYRGVVRYLRRRYGVPPVRAYRRVETPPGVQAQHDWFEARTRIRGQETEVQALVGTLSHSRGRFCWASEDATQLAWHTGHLALFDRYGGVPLWVRIDNLKTGVAQGAGATAVLNRSYEAFARGCGFEIDPCRARTASDKGKAERSVRTFRQSFGEVFRQDWVSWEAFQAGLDQQAWALMERLTCPVTGTSVREAFEAERMVLQPLPTMAEPFDVVVSRRVSRDCLISFEGRRYSVPFLWVGRQVEVLGTLKHVVVKVGGQEVARHPRGGRVLLVLDPDHYEGESTDQVIRPTPLGHRARLQMAGLSGPSRSALFLLPDPERIARPLDAYVQVVEALR
jgi:transposase